MALLFPGRPLRSLRQRWCYLSRFIFLPFLRFRHLHTLQPSCGNPRWSNLYRDSDSEPSQRRGLGGPARKRRPHSTGPWTGQVQHGYCLRHVPWYRVGLLIFKSRSHPRLYLAAAAAASASASDRTGHDLAGPGPNIL